MAKKLCPFIPRTAPTFYCEQQECEHWCVEWEECRLKVDAILNISMDDLRVLIKEIVKDVTQT